MTTLPLRLTFHSDWAIASGHARHDSLDLVVRRDSDGLPYVPGKTLRGIWRDAAEQLAIGLDDGSPGAWTEWCGYLWGDPAAGSRTAAGSPLVVTSAYLPDAVRSVLLAQPDVLKAAVVHRAMTAQDRETGTAKDTSLRIEERARAGCELEATAHVSLASSSSHDLDATWPGVFLVLAAARTVERAGGGRRRGAGRCSLTITEGSLEATWKAVLDRALGWQRAGAGVLPSPRDLQAVAPARSAEVFPATKPDAQDAWRRMVVLLETIDPVLVAARVLGNAVVSHSLIPGSTLIPVVAQCLGPDANRLISEGGLVVTDATPTEGPEGARSIPAPLCITLPKVVRDPDQDLPSNEMLGATARQSVPLTGFVVVTEGEPTPTLARRHARTVTTVHNVIDDGTQRPGTNGVYSYEALAPRQAFAFEVITRSDAAGELAKALDREFRIGGSRSAEYGRIRVTSVREVALSEDGQLGPLAAGDQVPIWLTSDVLPHGEPTVLGLLEDLSAEWKTRVTLVPDRDGPTAFGRPTRRESWQSQWRLPRPTLVGLAGGSCYLVCPEDPVSAGDVARVQLLGIGDRRAEGFGRILVNPPALRVGAPTVSNAPRGKPPFSDGPSDEGGLAKQEPDWMRAARRAAVLTVLTDAAAEAATAQVRLPQRLSRSQAGGLRQMAEGLVDGHGFDSARTWVASARASQTRKSRWSDALDWVGALLERPDAVWDTLGPEVRDRVITITGPAPTSGQRQALRRDAIRLLLLATVQAQRSRTAVADGKLVEREGTA